MARVALEQLCKIYSGPKGREIFAVKDVNLTIADKEFLVLVGPSGCGKSTTLRMIAGLEEISRGTIRIDDQVVNQVEPKDRDIAMVFQNYALYPHMTVYENMAFGLQLRKLPKTEIDQRVREAAQILGLLDLLDRLPKALSGGQRQRVAVGRAITRKPKVFLFDEPLSNLDAQMRVQMRLELSRLHRQLAATMIYVTHDQVEAMTMGDRIVVMKDGLIQQVDKPLALYQRPANLFVASFIGSPPMNILRGKIQNENGGLVFMEEASGTDVLKLPMPPEWKDTLGKKLGETVLLGLRAEQVSLGNQASAVGTATVEMVELLGAETLVHLRTGVHGLVARCGGGVSPQVGERLPVQFHTEHAIFFDPASGLAI